MRVTIGEIGASKVAGVAIQVVVLAVPHDIIDDNDGRSGLLDVVICGVIQLLGRGDIATCGLSTRYARKMGSGGNSCNAGNDRRDWSK